MPSKIEFVLSSKYPLILPLVIDKWILNRSFKATIQFLLLLVIALLFAHIDLNSAPLKQSDSRGLGSDTRLYVQSGHTDVITSVRFTADGNHILTSSNDKTVRLWDLASNREILTYSGHSNFVNGLAISNDKKSMLSAGWDNQLYFWDFENGSLTGHLPNLNEAVTYVSRTTKTGLVAVAGGNQYIKKKGDFKIQIINSNDKKVQTVINAGVFNVNCAEISPDESIIAFSATDKSLKLFSLAKNSLIKELNLETEVLSLFIINSASSQIVAAGCNDGSLRLYDAANLSLIKAYYDSKNPIRTVTGLDKSRIAASGDDGIIRIYDLEDSKLDYFVKALDSRVISIDYSSEQKLIAAACLDKTIRLIDISDGSTKSILSGKASNVWSLAMFPDGNGLTACTNDGNYVTWQFDDGRNIGRFKADSLTIRQCLPMNDGRRLLIVAQNTIKISDKQSGSTNKSISTSKNNNPIAAISPDDKFIAYSELNNSIVLINGESMSLITALEGHTRTVNSLTFSADGNLLASASSDKTIKIWDLSKSSASNNLKQTISGNAGKVAAIAFSPDGKQIICTGEDNLIKVWNIADGNLISTFPAEFSMNNVLAVSPRGDFVAYPGKGFAINLTNLKKKDTKSFIGHSNIINSIHFSKDGRYIFSSSIDNTIKIWELSTNSLLASLFLIGANDWAVVASDGRFDASKQGMEHIHYVRNNKPLKLESFLEKYYTPNLLGLLFQTKQQSSVRGEEFTKNFLLPPDIFIELPRNKLRTNKFVHKVNFTLSDLGGGIDEWRLYHNGKIYARENLSHLSNTSTIKKTVNTVLIPGQNVIKLTALNKDRIESVREYEIELMENPPKSDLYLLVVGVDNYKNENLKLKYAKRDADLFINTVSSQSSSLYSDIVRFEYFNEAATLSNIRDAINIIASTAKPNDSFIFYFAGHGFAAGNDGKASLQKDNSASDFFLLLHEVSTLSAPRSELEKNSISSSLIKEMSRRIQSQKQLLILDACHSGGFASDFVNSKSQEERTYMQLSRNTGVFIIASSGMDEKSSEYEELKHGVFTYALIKGLSGEADSGRNPDGKITVKELELYLTQKVPELTRIYRGSSQYPFSFSIGRDFPVVFAK